MWCQRLEFPWLGTMETADCRQLEIPRWLTGVHGGGEEGIALDWGKQAWRSPLGAQGHVGKSAPMEDFVAAGSKQQRKRLRC